MRLTYDPDVDAAYLCLTEIRAAGGVARTYPCDPLEVDGMINLDFDSAGRLIGLEVMGASAKLPPELLQAARRE